MITLTTLASLSALGTNHADAAAHGNGNAVSTSAVTTSYAYTTTAPTASYTATAPALSNTVTNNTASNQFASSPAVRTMDQTVVAKKAVATASVYNNIAALANSMAASRTYVYGGNTATQVDCSSFAQQVLAALGKSVPRTTYAQMAAGTPVSAPQPGDLVFFNGGSHVGVYIGGGQMVDALNPAEGVGQRPVSYVSGSITGYYRY
ncbi:NlpC/P60 family protein [Macrococcus lamae]|uniref:NlpC/P60 family protein n=2 Tax=Macrococcus lamae TaxID=198484 RepID=A0A4R6BVV9_9STAP|nr:NlpC/P60 family protein [Macrococcus lamae]